MPLGFIVRIWAVYPKIHYKLHPPLYTPFLYPNYVSEIPGNHPNLVHFLPRLPRQLDRIIVSPSQLFHLF